MFTDLYKLQGFHSVSVAIDLFCGAWATPTRNQYKQGGEAFWHVLDWAIPEIRFTFIKVPVLWYNVWWQWKIQGTAQCSENGVISHVSADYTWYLQQELLFQVHELETWEPQGTEQYESHWWICISISITREPRARFCHRARCESYSH